MAEPASGPTMVPTPPMIAALTVSTVQSSAKDPAGST